MSRPSMLLPGTVLVSEAADAARHAMCAFLRMEAEPDPLEEWLLGPYLEATRFVATMGSSILRTELEPAILEAQRGIGRIIEAAASGTLMRVLPAVVHIRQAHDLLGCHGFVPFDAPGATLAERTVALALADYLTRPEDFLAQEYTAAATRLRRLSSMSCPAMSEHDGIERRQ